MSKIGKFVKDRIKRNREKITAVVVSSPYLFSYGGQSVWVVDVLISGKSEIVKHVTIPENNREVRNFVTDGTPIFLQKDNAGQFFVAGLSNISKQNVVYNRFNLALNGLAFTRGIKITQDQSGTTGNGNQIDLGNETQATLGFEFSVVPYGELDYGTSVYGQKKATRI